MAGSIGWLQSGAMEMELLYNSGSEAIHFWDTLGGTERVTIQRTGNVGIGTVKPVAPLHVQQDAGVGAGFHTLAAFDRLGGFGGENGGALIGYHSDGSDVDFSTLFFLGGADGAIRLYDDSEGQVKTRLYIQADDGYVGFGTTTPQSTVHVSGYVQLDLTSGAPPGTDCDEASERGRMKVDSGAGDLYVCVDAGWVAK